MIIEEKKEGIFLTFFVCFLLVIAHISLCVIDVIINVFKKTKNRLKF